MLLIKCIKKCDLWKKKRIPGCCKMSDRHSNKISCNVYAKNVLSSHELELYELCRISGLSIDPAVFKILVDLLKMDVQAAAIFDVLQSISTQVSKPLPSQRKSQNSSITYLATKKKPPVAAKPKKIKGDHSDV